MRLVIVLVEQPPVSRASRLLVAVMMLVFQEDRHADVIGKIEVDPFLGQCLPGDEMPEIQVHRIAVPSRRPSQG